MGLEGCSRIAVLNISSWTPHAQEQPRQKFVYSQSQLTCNDDWRVCWISRDEISRKLWILPTSKRSRKEHAYKSVCGFTMCFIHKRMGILSMNECIGYLSSWSLWAKWASTSFPGKDVIYYEGLSREKPSKKRRGCELCWMVALMMLARYHFSVKAAQHVDLSI